MHKIFDTAIRKLFEIAGSVMDPQLLNREAVNNTSKKILDDIVDKIHALAEGNPELLAQNLSARATGPAEGEDPQEPTMVEHSDKAQELHDEIANSAERFAFDLGITLSHGKLYSDVPRAAQAAILGYCAAYEWDWYPESRDVRSPK